MPESGCNSKAISKMGSRGLMQLIPKTAEALGVEDSFNPEHNINDGAGYFKQPLNQSDGNVKWLLQITMLGAARSGNIKVSHPSRPRSTISKRVLKSYRFYKKHMEGEMNSF
jgi:soluble lytic murein transglycosylase-like protein